MVHSDKIWVELKKLRNCRAGDSRDQYMMHTAHFGSQFEHGGEVGIWAEKSKRPIEKNATCLLDVLMQGKMQLECVC